MTRHLLWIKVDNYKRILFLKYELQRFLLKSFKKNQNIIFVNRYKSLYFLTTLPKLSSFSYTNKRCVVSGRVWSVARKTNYSRFIFRTESYNANIPGISRASW